MELHHALELASDAADILRDQHRPDMAEAVETLRTVVARAAGEYLTASQAATALGVHRNTVRNWANRGLIRAIQVGARGDMRVPRAEVLWLQRLVDVSAAAGELTDRQMAEYFADRRASRRGRTITR